MTHHRAGLALLMACSVGFTAVHLAARQPQATATPSTRQAFSITVDGVARTGILFTPAKSEGAPLVFVFHGHGGSAENIARSFAMHRHWPEAVVLYLQGLPTPGRLVDPKGQLAGWQAAVGDQGDRDLKLFDAALASVLASTKADPKRVFATGHSNGGGMTYLLWAERGDRLAAVAPSAASAIQLMGKLKPKPVMHLAGQADPLVKYAWQRATMDGVRKLNRCEAAGAAWAPLTTWFASPSGTPCVEYVHPGGHQYPADAPALIARFFRDLR